MLFTAMNGNEMPGIVQEVTEDSVTVDFNHPLALQDVTFDIEVVSIDPTGGNNKCKYCWLTHEALCGC